MQWDPYGFKKMKQQKVVKKETNYDDWTKKELYKKAKELKIEGRSKMNKKALIKAIKSKMKSKKIPKKAPKPMF